MWLSRGVPLPPGEGGAERRVREFTPRGFGPLALIRRFAPPSPGGRRTRFRFSVMFIVAAVYVGLRVSVLGGLGIPASAQYMGGRLTYAERLMTSGRVFLEYLRLIFFPLNIAGDYDFNAIPLANLSSWDAWLGLSLIVAIIAMAMFLRRRSWVVSFGILFAFMVVVRASNL